MKQSNKTKVYRLIIYTLLMFACIVVNGQINVGSNEFPKLKPGDLNASDVAFFKKSTTVLVYPDNDSADVEQWKTRLMEIWTVTDLEFVPYSEFKTMKPEEDHSYLTIAGFIKFNEKSVSIYMYWNLWMLIDGKKKVFSRMELFPNYKTVWGFQTTFVNNKNEAKTQAYVYEKGEYYNMQFGILCNSLQEVNRYLKEGTVRYLFEKKTDGNLSPLKRETLYIPEYAIMKFNKWNGDESEKIDLAEVMEDYPYKYQVVSDEELNEMLLDSTQKTYYLYYVRSVADKFVSIVDGQSGTFLYSDYTPITYNLKDKDMKKLVKIIDTQ